MGHPHFDLQIISQFYVRFCQQEENARQLLRDRRIQTGDTAR
jgi:hypothetical protein